MKIAPICLAAKALATFLVIINASKASCAPSRTLETVTHALQAALDEAHEHGTLLLRNSVRYSAPDLEAVRAELALGDIRKIRISGRDRGAPEIINNSLRLLFMDLNAPELNTVSFTNVGIDNELGNAIADNIRNVNCLRTINLQNCGITDAIAIAITTTMWEKSVRILERPEFGAYFAVKFANEHDITINTRRAIEYANNRFMEDIRQTVPVSNPDRRYFGNANFIDLYPVIYRVIFE